VVGARRAGDPRRRQAVGQGAPGQVEAGGDRAADGINLDTIKRAVYAVTRAFAQDLSGENRRARKL